MLNLKVQMTAGQIDDFGQQMDQVVRLVIVRREEITQKRSFNHENFPQEIYEPLKGLWVFSLQGPESKSISGWKRFCPQKSLLKGQFCLKSTGTFGGGISVPNMSDWSQYSQDFILALACDNLTPRTNLEFIVGPSVTSFFCNYMLMCGGTNNKTSHEKVMKKMGKNY